MNITIKVNATKMRYYVIDKKFIYKKKINKQQKRCKIDSRLIRENKKQE